MKIWDVMKQNVYRTLICLFAGTLFAGCSVKEDREDCPCRLVLDFSEVDTFLVKSVEVLGVTGENVAFSDTLSADDFGEKYICEVVRESIRINIWSTVDYGCSFPEGITIPYGFECPRLYMQSFVADATGEVWYGKVRLRKNHCRLTVVMEGCDEIPYSFTFRGNVDGYGMDGNPSEGEFSCVAYPETVGSSSALIPRQIDNSLMLDIDDGTRVIKTFALGEYIAATGYDWTQPDLNDMEIIIDYAVTYIKISIPGWDKEYLYNIIL